MVETSNTAKAAFSPRSDPHRVRARAHATPRDALHPPRQPASNDSRRYSVRPHDLSDRLPRRDQRKRSGPLARPRRATLLAPETADLVPTLAPQLRDFPHSLVEVSHRQIALEVSGPHAAAVLNAGCPLNLDLSAFPVGMCTRTVFAKAEIVLWRTDETVFSRRSVALVRELHHRVSRRSCARGRRSDTDFGE